MILGRTPLHLHLILLTAALSSACHALKNRVWGRFGGAISTSETSGVKAEICRDHLDSSALHLKLPTGYRLRLAEEDRHLTLPLLHSEARPDSKALGAVGSSLFPVNGEFHCRQTPMNTADPMPAYLRAARRPTACGHAWQATDGYRSGAETLRTASTISKFCAQTRWRPTKIDVEQVSEDRWRLRLVLPTETVLADIQLTSLEVRPGDRADPGSCPFR